MSSAVAGRVGYILWHTASGLRGQAGPSPGRASTFSWLGRPRRGSTDIERENSACTYFGSTPSVSTCVA